MKGPTHMIAENPLLHKTPVRVVAVTAPRPTGPIDTAAHLRCLGTSIAPGPALGIRPARERRTMSVLAASGLALLALLLVVASAAAAIGPTPGYVMHTDDRAGDMLAAIVVEAPSTRDAREMVRGLDAWGVEDALGVRVIEEAAFTRAEARGLGLDEFVSYFVSYDRGTLFGFVNVARDGATVYVVTYISRDAAGGMDAAFAYQDRVYEDGIDARAPRGYDEYDREERTPDFVSESL